MNLFRYMAIYHCNTVFIMISRLLHMRKFRAANIAISKWVPQQLLSCKCDLLCFSPSFEQHNISNICKLILFILNIKMIMCYDTKINVGTYRIYNNKMTRTWMVKNNIFNSNNEPNREIFWHRKSSYNFIMWILSIHE